MPDGAYEQVQPQPKPNPWGQAAIDPNQAAYERHMRAISLLPGTDVAMATRFGGQSSRLHDIELRFGPEERDGTISGHLVVQTARGPVAARDVVVWDPVLRPLRSNASWELDALFEQLDPLSATCGSVSRGLSAAARVGVGIFGALLIPRFFVVGSVGAILLGYAIYYWLWFTVAGFLLVWVLLPGLALAGGCTVLHAYRRSRLHDAMMQAAWHAYDPETYHAPR